jgi:hypothetical protein
MRTLVLVLLVAGCIGSPETCVMDRLTYAGAGDGQVFVKVTYSSVAQPNAGQQMTSYPEVRLAMSTHQGTLGGFCWGSAIERNETARATAWIDVAARFPSGCGGVSFDDCVPHPSDPQGQGTFAIRDFEQNYLDIVQKDP